MRELATTGAQDEGRDGETRDEGLWSQTDLRFEVPVHNVLAVHVVEPEEHLDEPIHDCLLFEELVAGLIEGLVRRQTKSKY